MSLLVGIRKKRNQAGICIRGANQNIIIFRGSIDRQGIFGIVTRFHDVCIGVIISAHKVHLVRVITILSIDNVMTVTGNNHIGTTRTDRLGGLIQMIVCIEYIYRISINLMFFIIIARQILTPFIRATRLLDKIGKAIVTENKVIVSATI